MSPDVYTGLIGTLVVVFIALVAFGEPLERRLRRRLRRAWRAWWRQRWANIQRRWLRIRLDETSPFGFYAFVVINPVTGETTHGKLGEGVIRDRLRTHRTVADIKVMRIVRTKTKRDGYRLEQRVKAALTEAGLMLPPERPYGVGVEQFYDTPEAWKIIDHELQRASRGGTS